MVRRSDRRAPDRGRGLDDSVAAMWRAVSIAVSLLICFAFGAPLWIAWVAKEGPVNWDAVSAIGQLVGAIVAAIAAWFAMRAAEASRASADATQSTVDEMRAQRLASVRPLVFVDGINTSRGGTGLEAITAIHLWMINHGITPRSSTPARVSTYDGPAVTGDRSRGAARRTTVAPERRAHRGCLPDRCRPHAVAGVRRHRAAREGCGRPLPVRREWTALRHAAVAPLERHLDVGIARMPIYRPACLRGESAVLGKMTPTVAAERRLPFLYSFAECRLRAPLPGRYDPRRGVWMVVGTGTGPVPLVREPSWLARTETLTEVRNEHSDED